MSTGTAVYFAYAAEAWLLFVLAIFCHGTISSFFRGTAPHELGHGTVFDTKWLNKLFFLPFQSIKLVEPI
jgi:fatty acid desaturase